VLTVDRCRSPSTAFDTAVADCEAKGMHLPRIFELAEVRASGAALDDVDDEWLFDRTVTRLDADGTLLARAPNETQIAFRCVIELPLPSK
jgi:hypothetical protein